LVLIAAIDFGLIKIQPSRKDYRLFPMWPSSVPNFTDMTGNSHWRSLPSLSYPHPEKPLLPNWACAMIAMILPTVVIALFQIRVRCWWDFHTGVFGVWKAIGLGNLWFVILKQTIGGFRPYYLDLCKPDPTQFAYAISGTYFYNWKACTGTGTGFDEQSFAGIVKNSLQSFPSGHTATSFAAATFLSLYMHAKFTSPFFLTGVTRAYYPLWEVWVVLVPLIGASVIAGDLHVDHSHHPEDIIAGALIGIFVGVLSYSTSFQALWDEEKNHLHRFKIVRWDGMVGDVLVTTTGNTIDDPAGSGVERGVQMECQADCGDQLEAIDQVQLGTICCDEEWGY